VSGADFDPKIAAKTGDFRQKLAIFLKHLAILSKNCPFSMNIWRFATNELAIFF
jgi:hypothetical protein